MSQLDTNSIPLCTAPGSCDNLLCQGYYTRVHEITAGDFASMKAAYFNGFPIAPNGIVPVADFDLSSPCGNNLIYFAYDSTDKTTNTDIIVSNAQIPDPNLSKCQFSKTLFKGVLGLFNPATFGLSKALNSLGAPTLIFVGLSSTNQPVYWGDINEIFP